MDAYPHGWIGSCPVIVGMYHHIHVLSREQPFFSRWAFDDMRRYDIAVCRKIPLRDGPKGQPPFQLKSVHSADRRPATAPVLSPRAPGRAVPALTKASPGVPGGKDRWPAGYFDDLYEISPCLQSPRIRILRQGVLRRRPALAAKKSGFWTRASAAANAKAARPLFGRSGFRMKRKLVRQPGMACIYGNARAKARLVAAFSRGQESAGQESLMPCGL